VKVESDIRDFKPVNLAQTVPFKTGDWYDAKRVEDTVTSLTETAGLFGYAFAEVRPRFNRDKEARRCRSRSTSARRSAFTSSASTSTATR
jgi:outer membrane protein insertion porin family